MKVYDKRLSEGHRNVIGYLCDYCEIYLKGEELHLSWIQEQDKHYCPDCTTFCILCKKSFSREYAESWFKKEMCETCQNLNEEKP